MQPFAGSRLPQDCAVSEDSAEPVGAGKPAKAVQRPPSPVHGSSPIPRKITLVTVCTALSNAMSDSISPPFSNCTW